MTRFTVAVSLLLASTAHPSGPAAKGVRFNCGAPRKPTASVHITQLATKPSKHGFLRVATLPTVAASGVEVRVKDPASNFLWDFSEYITSLAKSQNFELQNLAIYLGDEKMPRLTAKSATVSQQKWELQQIRILSPDEIPRSFPSASINTSLTPTELSLPKVPNLRILTILATSTASPP